MGDVVNITPAAFTSGSPGTFLSNLCCEIVPLTSGPAGEVGVLAAPQAQLTYFIDTHTS